MNNDNETPKKILASQVEVLGANGEVVKPSEEDPSQKPQWNGFGQVRVIKGGPWMLLFIPVLIPILIVGFFLMMVLALFFGKSMLKIAKGQLRPRG